MRIRFPHLWSRRSELEDEVSSWEASPQCDQHATVDDDDGGTEHERLSAQRVSDVA